MTTPTSIRVLHVDDEPEVVELTAEMLEREDNRITVETVTAASECLDHFFEREYDCIVSDYDMPEMTGIELLERVREEHGDFPFILFTGKGSEEVASDAISAGVTDYLQKQADSGQYTVLANRLTNAVEQYRAKQRLEERERELRRKQEYLDTILEHTTTPIFMKDHEGRYVFTNRAYREGFDIDGEIAGKTAHDIYPPEMADAIEEYDRTVLDTGEPIEFEGTENIDGEERTFLTTLVPVSETDAHPDQEGRVALFGVASDITDLKRREHELERERDRVNALFQNMAEPIAYYEFEDGDPIAKEVNPAFEETFGVSREEVHGRSLDDVLVPGEYTEEGKRINERVRAGDIVDTEVTRQAHDGLREFNLVSVPLEPGKSGEQGFTIYTDITERKEHERELEEIRERMEFTLDGTDSVIYDVDLQTYEETRHGPFERLYGLDPEEYSQTSEFYDAAIHPEDREKMRVFERREELRNRETVEWEYRTHPDRGEVRWLYSIADIRSGPEGEPTRAFGLVTDVTERKLRERELQRKQRIIQEMDDGVVVVQNQTITYTNPQVSEIIGYPAEALVGEPMGKYIVPEDRDTVRRRYEERLAGNEPPKTYEISLLTRDGGTVPVEITAARVTYGDEPATVSIVRDITDRKERIRELERQNERLDEFASIVSHDLRNPLNVASSRLELAQDTCDSPHLADIADAHDRMERLIDDLLTLARQGEEVREMESVSVAALAGECWDNVATAGARLKTDADVTVRADRNRLKQVLENLIRNAVEHGNPEVTVWIDELAAEPGFYVADDGPGIPEDSRDEVLESGYSTAETGTGFGLAIVREIVEAHDWGITVTDSDEGGARFEITGVDIVDC